MSDYLITESGELSNSIFVISDILDALLAFTVKLQETVSLSSDLLTCDMKDSLAVPDDQIREPYLEDFSVLKTKKLDVIDFVELLFSRSTKLLLACIDKHLPWLVLTSPKEEKSDGALPHVLVLLVCNCIRLLVVLTELAQSVFCEETLEKGLNCKVDTYMYMYV